MSLLVLCTFDPCPHFLSVLLRVSLIFSVRIMLGTCAQIGHYLVSLMVIIATSAPSNTSTGIYLGLNRHGCLQNASINPWNITRSSLQSHNSWNNVNYQAACSLAKQCLLLCRHMPWVYATKPAASAQMPLTSLSCRWWRIPLILIAL